jgi:hypothetical protein
MDTGCSHYFETGAWRSLVANTIMLMVLRYSYCYVLFCSKRILPVQYMSPTKAIQSFAEGRVLLALRGGSVKTPWRFGTWKHHTDIRRGCRLFVMHHESLIVKIINEHASSDPVLSCDSVLNYSGEVYANNEHRMIK